MGTITEKFAYALETKSLIRLAIAEMGVEIPEDTVFRDYPNYIRMISGGSGDDNSGEDTGGGEGGDTELLLQEKTALPSYEDVVVVPDEGYDALSAVTQPAMTNLRPWNLRRGITVLGVTGTADLE